MSTLSPCEGCGRHVRTADARCPFCDLPRSTLARIATAAVGVAIAATTTVTLAACYGPAPPRPQPPGNPQTTTERWSAEDQDAAPSGTTTPTGPITPVDPPKPNQ
jgi:hypothetical protein